MSKPRVATVWLDGCSGCHMSLIDLDELGFARRAFLRHDRRLDGCDLPIEAAFLLGARRVVLGRESEGVDIIAREAALFGDALGGAEL